MNKYDNERRSSQRVLKDIDGKVQDKMDFSYRKRLSIGNRVIDTAHEKILHMVNRIEYLIEVRDCHALSETFNLLEDYLSDYFLAEEGIAQAINFPFTQHDVAHQYLLNKVQQTKNELAANDGMWSDTTAKHYSKLLRDCLSKHIKVESKPIKIMLVNRFYDFSPS
jgi:hemerythrin-like metal-binding protein